MAAGWTRDRIVDQLHLEDKLTCSELLLQPWLFSQLGRQSKVSSQVETQPLQLCELLPGSFLSS